MGVVQRASESCLYSGQQTFGFHLLTKRVRCAGSLPIHVCLPGGHFSRVAVVRYGLLPIDIDSSSHSYPLSPIEMTTPFPLLRLPRHALIPVFQQMELIDV